MTIPPNQTPGGGVALLIDGENISGEHAGRIISKARTFGPLVVRRVYGNATRMPTWDTAPGFRVMHSATAKNSADMLLAIEAVALAHSRTIDTFVIASSDGDFSHLAHHLREQGLATVGIGEAKAPLAFRKACTEFEEISRKRADPGMAVDDLDHKITVLIRSESDENAMRISDLNGRMRKAHDFKISEHPRKTWRAYLLSRPELFSCDPKGPESCVRLKSS